MVTSRGGGYLTRRYRFQLRRGVDALDRSYLFEAKDRRGDAESFISAGQTKPGVTSLWLLWVPSILTLPRDKASDLYLAKYFPGICQFCMRFIFSMFVFKLRTWLCHVIFGCMTLIKFVSFEMWNNCSQECAFEIEWCFESSLCWHVYLYKIQ